MVDKATLDGLRIARDERDTERRGARWWIFIPIVLIAIAIAAWAFTRSSALEVTTAPAKAITSAAQGSVLNASGYVTARRRATVSSKVTGKVTDVFVEEGLHVKAGQELARLDESYASKGLALAQAEASAAASALEETRVRIREAQLDYDRAAHLRDRMMTAFIRSSQWEWLFWDGAYRQRGWPVAIV